jgi:hypothetical protein
MRKEASARYLRYKPVRQSLITARPPPAAAIPLKPTLISALDIALAQAPILTSSAANDSNYRVFTMQPANGLHPITILLFTMQPANGLHPITIFSAEATADNARAARATSKSLFISFLSPFHDPKFANQRS